LLQLSGGQLNELKYTAQVAQAGNKSIAAIGA